MGTVRRRRAALAAAAAVLISPPPAKFCRGFCIPPTPRDRFPPRLDTWDRRDVEAWLRAVGFGRYAGGFADDFGGAGVDGDRLLYLGTEDQLDHIEYQLSLVGVDDEDDQRVLGAAIIALVAAREVTPDLVEALASRVPVENRDRRGGDEGEDRNRDLDGGTDPEYQI